MRRSACSVPSNIAEGSTKSSLKERRRYINIAYASAQELRSHLDIVKTCNMIRTDQLKSIDDLLVQTLKLLNCYYKKPM
ncbi:four helix bundle protein [Candidatus Uhrbacteria bacterium]|nr:four helix bundle protein [Candidatus Uhrbacteria bacterium]MBD3284334.1 four helix bundle protein [Candidatus Uhrbacteria bacterium]